MVAINEGTLRRRLEAQGFRIEEQKGGFIVKAPEGADVHGTSGVVRVHSTSLRGEGLAWNSVLGDLKRIGYDPDWKAEKDRTVVRDVPAPVLEEPVVEAVPIAEPDPNDRWVTYAEAAKVVGMGASGISQRVKAGKLEARKMPAQVPGPGGALRTHQLWHVNLAEVIASGTSHRGPRGRKGTAPTPTEPRVGPTRTRYEDSAVGRLKEASVKLVAAARRVDAGMTEMVAAAEVIGREATATLQELHDTKQRLKGVEKWLEQGVSKL